MRRKYFMRGLGLGIIVTSALFFIASVFETPVSDSQLTDAEIIAAARNLGMVMESEESSSANNKTADIDVSGIRDRAGYKEEQYELLASELRKSLDMDAIYGLF